MSLSHLRMIMMLTCAARRTIYENLSKVGDSDDQKLYRERADDIEPNIRFCAYNLGGDRKSTSTQAQQAAASAAGSELMKKIEDALEESRKSASKSVRDVQWQGRTVQVKSEKLSDAMLAAQELLLELDKAGGEQHALDKRFELYDRLFVAYNDAVRIARDEMTAKVPLPFLACAVFALLSMADTRCGVQAKGGAKKTAKSEETVQSLELVAKYLAHQKLSYTFERNLLMVEQAQRRWQGTGMRRASLQFAAC